MATIEQLEARCLLSAKMGPEIFVQSVVAAPLADGSLLVAGTTSNAPYGARPGEQALFFMRYNADGTRDATFGGNGKVEKQHPGLAAVKDLLTTPDGKILVLEEYDGTHDGPAAGQYWALYSDGGMLQRSFGADGLAAAPGHIDARQFASDNKLVMAYRTGDFLHPDSAEEFVTMMNPDGTMDQAFGGGVDTGLSAAQTIRVQSDGKIIIVGSIHVHSTDTGTDSFQSATTRVNPDGTKDAQFGEVEPVEIKGDAYAQTKVLASGKIVESSISGTDTAKVTTLHRYLPDGDVDATQGALPGAASSLSAARNDGAVGRDGGSNALVGGSLPTAWVLGACAADANTGAVVATTQPFVDAGAGTVLASAAVNERVLALLRAVNSEAHPGKAALTKKGTLDVQGTDDDDVIRVRRSGDKVIVGINKLVQTFEMAKVKRVVVNAGKGNDAITLVGNLRRGYVNGGPGDDTIVGGDEDDVLTGGVGNDLIYGGRGNDRINGSGGKDTIFGEAGDDRLFGGAGNDALDGGPGADTIDGGEGADALMNVTKDDVVVSDPMDSIVTP